MLRFSDANRTDRCFAGCRTESPRRSDSGTARPPETSRPFAREQGVRPRRLRTGTRSPQAQIERRRAKGDRGRGEKTMGGGQGWESVFAGWEEDEQESGVGCYRSPADTVARVHP